MLQKSTGKVAFLKEELAAARLANELSAKDLSYSNIKLEKAVSWKANLETEMVAVKEKHAMTQSYLRSASIELASTKESLAKVQPDLDAAKAELIAERAKSKSLEDELFAARSELGAELAQSKAQLLSATNLKVQYEGRATKAEKALIRLESESRSEMKKKGVDEELAATLEVLNASQSSVQTLTNEVNLLCRNF